ncbi:MAG: hypothetical protein A2X67_13790 [Ignavibacteria bacterium GWA2_55_11]|nr:MAG: hypothetical protein A2X67_13790 [Ignavibacteria bacterium GWA2_55_11]OGU47253.1 MAG: hypothetical protein A2X68_09955 [Ignavibacteria bacterium GWC2_56_12]OGU63205.1 MAG: hypothetical protein A3C56_01700 [Ignavibacteria bacterium RIFCSPHIGHO2_02_FULL_56_12]OGU75661.1 MAG: hypothetical protein A3G43_13870 [Ignavibacteria bacterium RIFCSPLOWO2_12_FULL_56_21]HAV23719.1 hypothetical protein [Bacteroidota bacterium]
MKKYPLFALLLFLSCSTEPAEVLPPSSELDIPLLTQSIPSRSWATCGRMIYLYRDTSFTMSECELMSAVRYMQIDCCAQPDSCDTTYTTIGIAAGLSAAVNRAYMQFFGTPPLEQMHEYFHEYHVPILVLTKGSPHESAGHFVVVRGLRFVDEKYNPVMLVNDPLGYFSSEMRYREFQDVCVSAAFLM